MLKSNPSEIIFPKEKKEKKKAFQIEEMTYENGRKHD